MQEQAAELQSLQVLGIEAARRTIMQEIKVTQLGCRARVLDRPAPPKKTLLRVVIYDAKAYMDTAVLVISQSLALVSSCHM